MPRIGVSGAEISAKRHVGVIAPPVCEPFGGRSADARAFAVLENLRVAVGEFCFGPYLLSGRRIRASACVATDTLEPRANSVDVLADDRYYRVKPSLCLLSRRSTTRSGSGLVIRIARIVPKRHARPNESRPSRPRRVSVSCRVPGPLRLPIDTGACHAARCECPVGLEPHQRSTSSLGTHFPAPAVNSVPDQT